VSQEAPHRGGRIFIELFTFSGDCITPYLEVHLLSKREDLF
jgi:hypothetical protein